MQGGEAATGKGAEEGGGREGVEDADVGYPDTISVLGRRGESDKGSRCG